MEVTKNYNIKENSWLAKIAARKLKFRRVAMVFGNTIHLYNVSKETFLQNEKWVKHELCHINQFKDHGFIFFIVKYLWEWKKNGYYNNKYEVEARRFENS